VIVTLTVRLPVVVNVNGSVFAVVVCVASRLFPASKICHWYDVTCPLEVPVTLAVNGVVVPVPNVTLTAGADYTLLVWSDASGAQLSLIVDDNRLPAGGTGVTKLRLLNGMSTLAAPLTLSVDFSPVIEGTLLGQVSDEIEISGGTDRQFDLSNTSTAQSVLTRSSITLQGNSVYTFFMTDNGATPIGVLRRDR